VTDLNEVTSTICYKCST